MALSSTVLEKVKFNIFGITPGNTALCIGYKIYGIGNNGFHPNNSVDELLYCGETFVGKRTGRDWGWDDGSDEEEEQNYRLVNPEGKLGDGIKFYGTLEQAIEIAKSLPDDPSKTFHERDEWETYIRSLASNSQELKRRRDILDYSSESGLYSFVFDRYSIYLGIRMRIESDKVTAYTGTRPKSFYHSFDW
jgi:hypothetical protein